MAIQVKYLSVSTTSSSVSFSPSVKRVILFNSGNNICYFKINSTATINDFEIKPYETIILSILNILSIHAITSSSTTTLNIIGS